MLSTRWSRYTRTPWIGVVSLLVLIGIYTLRPTLLAHKFITTCTAGKNPLLFDHMISCGPLNTLHMISSMVHSILSCELH
jgi:hypothetical protein